MNILLAKQALKKAFDEAEADPSEGFIGMMLALEHSEKQTVFGAIPHGNSRVFHNTANVTIELIRGSISIVEKGVGSLLLKPGALKTIPMRNVYSVTPLEEGSIVKLTFEPGWHPGDVLPA